jgi:adenylylsulfate kinase
MNDLFSTTPPKNSLLKQRGIVVWLLGLSGAGKSTLATLLEKELTEKGYFSVMLDGDNLRSGINKNLSFNSEDRAENIRRAAEIAKLLVSNNIITICSFITPLQAHRDLAREIIGEDYFEVFVDCPLEVCEQRDVKGLYKKARREGIANFTGISSSFEPSASSELILTTAQQSPQESVEILLEALKIRIAAV